jgi:pyruvate dehydrogenase E2 component (dihydrolipoamide acetyltransferase)
MPIEVVMPALGLTVDKGIVSEWLKHEGETVTKGESIFLVDADKAVTEVESPASGILAKILVQENIEVPVFTVMAVITEEGEKLADLSITKTNVDRVEAHQTKYLALKETKPLSSAFSDHTSAPRAVPAARKQAKTYGLDLSVIVGTGPKGVILVKDIESVLASDQKQTEVNASSLAKKIAEKESVSLKDVEGTGVRGRIMRHDIESSSQTPQSQTPTLGSTVSMSKIRKIIADRMTQSAFSAPHIYFFSEIHMDPLLNFRKEIQPDFESAYNLKVSINDFLIKAVALAIQEFPVINARIEKDQIHISPLINVGLAVAQPEGLIVPVIKNANQLGLADICKLREDSVNRARTGKLLLSETEEGTFTISSLASFDITHFTAILNPPQSGILSVGKLDEKLVMMDGQVCCKKVIQFGLSVDHRIIDGAIAAGFLQNLKKKIEKPNFTFCVS